MLIQRLKDKLNKRSHQDALRSLASYPHLVDFCSNDYLGFTKKKWSSPQKDGSSGSRLLSGNSQIHEDCEQFLASFYQTESSLLYNSGYDANLGFFSCVPQKGDTVIYDQLCHASIRDGIRLGSARNFSFKHNDLKELKSKIHRATGSCFVVVESVYSMDGDFAPLQEIAQLCQKLGAYLIVDEAHATGLFGSNGQGLSEGHNTFARIHTFGKALGCHGAVIVGSQLLKNFLINFSRPLIYTTALSPHAVSCIIQAHEAVRNCTQRELLQENIAFFKDHMSHNQMLESKSAIQCLIVPGNKACKEMAKKLHKEGYDIRPILYPTVKKGEERLRICLHSFNTKKQILHLCQLLNT